MSMRVSRQLCERRDLPSARRMNLHAGLVARSREMAHIDQLLWQARRGKSGALALRGESGVGKSALIEATVARATEFRTVQVRGAVPGDAAEIQRQWPDPLSELASSMDVEAAEAPRLVGAPDVAAPVPATPSPGAVEAAARSFRRLVEASGGPLLVTVDDCHVLPPELVVAMAAAVLAHLGDEPISLVLAWRDTPHLESFDLGRGDVPVHRLGGLTVPQARELLASRFDQPPSEPVLAELVGRTGGNPLALVDLCARLTPAHLAGWHPLPDPLPISGVLADAFDVIRYLPPPTRRALAVVAAGGATRDAMFAAMQRLGVTAGDLTPAMDAGVIYERGPRIDFRHQLVRSVAFHRAPPEVRQAVRAALSDVLAENHAIEASAYHASVDLVAPDEVAARRLAEAARVALDRGDPAAAARHEELAARCAPGPDTVGQHLADAAGHWLAAGERERARYCVESGAGLPVTGPVAGELAYQRARVFVDPDGATADQMTAAADACIAERPHRALTMLVDAAAWRMLTNEHREAEAVAERAVRLAAAVSSHSEVLARAVRAAAVLAGGGEIDEIAERSHVSLLIGQTERFPSSPEVALVIGRGLAQQGLRRQAERWVQWVARCAEQSGDISLGVVPLLLEGAMSLADGDLDEARDAVLAGATAADDAGSAAMAAWGWQLATQVHAIAGRYEDGFTGAARLFGMTDRLGELARLRALPALALLELQRGRRGPALAWASSVEHDLGLRDVAPRRVSALALELAPLVASVRVLARSPIDAGEWEAVTEEDGGGGSSRQIARAWLRGLRAERPEAALDDLAAASAGLHEQPFRQALVDICWAVRLAEAGMATEAAQRLGSLSQRLRQVGAAGLATLAEMERSLLPADVARTVLAVPEGLDGPHQAPSSRQAGGAPAAADWEISMLGGFSIRHRAKTVALPASLATQAVKIVALHPRITVDELIEYLWEDAEPGVGARRLRNVLWRIRSACGDLLVREGNFVRLAPGASTDVARFRALAEQALVGVDAGTPRAVEAAREAVDCYRGELLPGDRYADWTAAARESVARTHLRLLELLVDDALVGDRQGEALVLLDRMAEIDPFDERHHLRTAEIHLQAGNRGRALDALARAERMLAELRVSPSVAVRRLRESLDQA